VVDGLIATSKQVKSWMLDSVGNVGLTADHTITMINKRLTVTRRGAGTDNLPGAPGFTHAF